jgi:multicomponent Na+:H+ antiporter subunit C
MSFLLALAVGVLYGAGFFMLMKRSLVKLIMGLILISHAANLLIFTSGGLSKGSSPIIPEGASTPSLPTVDPIPQALILTAIVISFGVLSFVLILVYRFFEGTGRDDTDSMKATE